MKRKLNFFKVAISLISLHYGLGFLMGTSEAVFNSGLLLGITYPLSCAAGLFLLSLISKFYWKKRYPIWILLGNSFGKTVKDGVCFLSWFWMIGIVASQVVGASFILGILRVPPNVGAILIIIMISLFSLLPIEKLSNLFLSLLFLNSIGIVIGISKVALPDTFKLMFLSIPKDFFNKNILSILGVALPTIFITLLGMDFHQFIVQAKDPKQAVTGSLIGGLGLTLMTLLPAVITFGAINNKILPPNIDGKQVIPFVFLYEGEKFGFPFIGKLLVASLLTVALASGSALTRILTQTFFDFVFIPSRWKSKRNILIINALIIFFLALTGKTIISLIVCFYAIYLSGVTIPFIVYIVQSNRLFYFPKRAVCSSLILGAASSLIILILSIINALPAVLNKNLELFMILFGIFSSIIALLINLFIVYLVKKFFLKNFLKN